MGGFIKQLFSLSSSGETEDMEVQTPVNLPPPKNGPQQNQKRNSKVSRKAVHITLNKKTAVCEATTSETHVYDAEAS